MTDPAIIEAAARALSVANTGGERTWAFENERKHYSRLAEAALAAVAPLILERAAIVAEVYSSTYPDPVAAAIRALKEQP